MTREEKAISVLYGIRADNLNLDDAYTKDKYDALTLAIKALEQEPRKGEWLRMSDLSEQEDDRYKCSCCGNVVHYTNKINLYTFNNWCGRCGRDNGIHINCEVDE